MNRPLPDASGKLLLNALNGVELARPPIWLMRQAGRYLPEYRELRQKASSFMEFCFSPKLTVEATLQPIRRFEFDASIIFSDILVIPHVLGQTVSFETGKGPVLEPIDSVERFRSLKEEIDLEDLSTVFEALQEVRSKLPSTTTLIGFCGAPWTVASYMIAGHGTPDQAPARLFAYQNRALFGELVDRLVASSIIYLSHQISAGADVVQIFDSWAGVLPVREFEEWSLGPIRRIVAGLKTLHPDAKVIVFARGVGVNVAQFAALEGVSCVGLDTSTGLEWVQQNLQPSVCVQGNLDPLALVAGGDEMDKSVGRILDCFGSRHFIFNLGHGILPQTPIANVERLVKAVRGE